MCTFGKGISLKGALYFSSSRQLSSGKLYSEFYSSINSFYARALFCFCKVVNIFELRNILTKLLYLNIRFSGAWIRFSSTILRDLKKVDATPIPIHFEIMIRRLTLFCLVQGFSNVWPRTYVKITKRLQTLNIVWPS